MHRVLCQKKFYPFDQNIIEDTGKDRGMEKFEITELWEYIVCKFFLKIDVKPFINISSRWMILETRNGR